MTKALLCLLAIFALAASGDAGTLTGGLMDAFSTKRSDEKVPVVIVLMDRTDADGMLRQLLNYGMSLPQTHSPIMDSLRSRAAASQASVLRSLEILQSTGMGENARPLWIVNAIAADLTKAGAELIANMAEVAEVGLDETAVLRYPVESAPASGVRSNVEISLLRTGVHDVWATGFRGDGRVIAALGEGASLTHPALSSRWVGRAASEGQAWFDSREKDARQHCRDVNTQLLGVACGADPQSADTIGVAPAARWITAEVFQCGRARLSEILAALQWLADPDGDPYTVGDVPDAVCCAFGFEHGCEGGEPRAIWEAFENTEVLGPLLVFAVDNAVVDGSVTVQSPESRDDCFAVGSADARTPAITVSPSSARGPSPCDQAIIKPNLVAPGVSVRTASAEAPEKYARITGAGVAAAYVAGVATLLKQANPNLTAFDLKRILAVSAVDGGSPGPDNAFGAGFINASAALTMALSSGRSGTLQGSVNYGGQPIAGARVIASGDFGDVKTTSRYDGLFRFEHLVADRRYRLRVGRFGFQFFVRPDSIEVGAGRTVTVVVDLRREFRDDAEYDQGWSLGVEGDNATGGVWTRAIPVASTANGNPVQPSTAVSGRYCFVTGNASSPTSDPGEEDVDGGHTTLRSPRFNLTELAEPVLEFSYWYSNDRGVNPGGDFFRAQISSDDGVTWTHLINTASSTDGWKRVSVRIADFVTVSSHMALQFVAEDDGPGSLVEAAVDDIFITGAPNVPEPPRELTLDVQFDQVVLTWRPSLGAVSYRVYLGGDPHEIVRPENLYATTSDTMLIVPMTEIHHSQFYFQVTAAK